MSDMKTELPKIMPPITYELMEETEETSYRAMTWIWNHDEEVRKLSTREIGRVMNALYRTELPSEKLDKMNTEEILALYEQLESN